MNVVALIRRNPVLGAAPANALRRLADASDVRTYDPGARLVRAGGAQRHVLLVAEGRIELGHRNRSAKRQVFLGVLSAPSIFGDAELYAGTSAWMVSASAVEPSVVVWMPNEHFDRFVGSSGPVALGLYREACARHMSAIQMGLFLSMQDTRKQIFRLLWDLVGDESKRGVEKSEPPIVPLSYVRIARALGVDRKTVSRNLKAMEESGLIAIKKDRVVLRIARGAAGIEEPRSRGFGCSIGLVRPLRK